jgi:hypothetical protein
MKFQVKRKWEFSDSKTRCLLTAGGVGLSDLCLVKDKFEYSGFLFISVICGSGGIGTSHSAATDQSG